MDHSEATKKLAAEQYLLGEFSETEREKFERHFFDCPECSGAVETAGVLISNAKAVLREPKPAERRAPVPEWNKWFSLAGWGFVRTGAMAGCTILAALSGYQNLVQIPAMRANAVSSELVMAPASSVSAARAQERLTFSKRNGTMSITVAHEWEEIYSRYEAGIERVADHLVIAKAEIPATPSDITVTARLQPFVTGSYFLNLYGTREGSEERIVVARVPLALTD